MQYVVIVSTEINILIMDNFVAKMLSASSQEKKRLHFLPVNISVKYRARNKVCWRSILCWRWSVILLFVQHMVVDLWWTSTLKLSHGNWAVLVSSKVVCCLLFACDNKLTSDFNNLKCGIKWFISAVCIIPLCSNCFLNSKKWIMLLLDLIKQG